MASDTNVTQLVINRLSNEQYETAVKSDTELWLTPELPASTTNLGPVKVDGTTITASADGTLTAVAQMTVDSALSTTSTNPVQNKVVTTNMVKGVTGSGATITVTKGDNTTSTFTIDNVTNASKATYDSNGDEIAATYAKTSALATVATSGSYNDLSNKPTIPTVNNATLTIQKNGTNVATFTANSSTNTTANISVPTKLSEFTDDLGSSPTHTHSQYSTVTDTVTSVAAGTSANQINVTKNGSTSTITVNNVANATKATKDGDGNTISSTYIKTSTKGAANGVASLDSNTKVPVAQIPDLSGTYSTVANTVTNVVAGNTADKISVTKNGTTSTITVNNVSNATNATNATNDVDGNPIKTTYAKVSSLATVATSGSYNDLSNKPTIPADISSNKINGIPLSTASGYFFATSDTAAATTEKVVSIPSVTTLSAGTVIIIKPTVTSTVANSTIKLNNFTAYPMRYRGNAITTSTDSIVWPANTPTIWVFDGDYWNFAGKGQDDNTTYSNMSVSEGTTGTATTSRAMRADYLKQIIQGTVLTGLDTSSATAIDDTDTVLSGLGKLQAQVSTKADSATTLSGYGITDAYTKTEIDGMVSAGMHYKGTVASASNLPSSGNKIGDLYNVTDTGANYAWNGTEWDKLSENIDLSGLASKAEAAGSLSGSNATLTLKNVNGGTLSTVTVNNVANATNATNATKATQDASGNVITTTYSTKAETVTDVVSGSTADKINVTKNGSTSTITVNNVANATSAGKVEATVAAGSDLDIVKATVGANDYARVRMGGASNAGYLEVATADDGNEPIYVRQYTGNFSTVKRTLTLLDDSGNTTFPGTLTSGAITSSGTITASSFSGNVNGDNYVQWGGPSLAGSISPTDAGCIDDHGHNKAAFFGGEIKVQYSTDGGTTWTTPEVLTDAKKFQLTTKGGLGLSIGNVWSSGVITSENIANYLARITISSRNSSGSGAFYTSMRKLLCNVSTNGATGCKIKLEHRTIANYNNGKDTWTERGNYNVSGWSGWNSIPVNIAFGGGATQTGQIADLRLTLSATGAGSTSTNNFQLSDIRILGVSNWGVPSFALTGHIYDFDVNKNVTFPNKVTASTGGFTGNLTGNVTGNLTGTASKATADADGNTISTTYLKVANAVTGVKGNSESSYRTGQVNITPTNIGLGNVTNNKQVKGLSSGTTSGHVVTWGSDGYTVADSGFTIAKSVPSDAKFTDTTYSAGTGLSLSGTTINHASSITAGTAGTSEETTGDSFSIPYVTYNASGHITAAGTHTHKLYQSKTYTGLIGTSNEWKNATFYFLTVRPVNWNKEWTVQYRLEAGLDDGITPSNYQYFTSQHECYLSGRQGVYTAYSNFNSISSTDYRTIYYHINQRTTEAGYNAGNGHKIGIDLTSAKEPINTSYKRTIKITILNSENCTVTFNETPEIPSNSTRTDYTKLNSTYYTTTEANSAGNWSRLNGYTNGLQETGDANDNTYNQLMMSNGYLVNGSYNGSTGLYIFNYNIIGFDKDGKALCISVPSSSATAASTAVNTARVYNTVGFDYNKGLMYTGQNTAYASGANMNISPRVAQSQLDLRYSDNAVASSSANTLGLVVRKPIYLRGTIGNDGLFYLAPMEVTYNSATYKRAWTQDIPTTEDGYVYWFIGFPYYNSSYPNSLYQINFYPDKQVFHFKDGKYQIYVPTGSASNSGSFTTSNWTLSNSKYNYTITLANAQLNANVLFYDSNNQQIFPEEVKLTKSNGKITSITAVIGSDPDCRFAGTYSIFY